MSERGPPSCVPLIATAKRCLVVCDTARGVVECSISAPGAATVSECLELARAQTASMDIDWNAATCGIWGRVCQRSAVPVDGDRIEVYRPLPGDPRARRRARVTEARKRVQREASVPRPR